MFEHLALMNLRSGSLTDGVAEFFVHLPAVDFPQVALAPPEQKQPTPASPGPLPADILGVLAALTTEFFASGRFHLTGNQLSGPPTLPQNENQLASRGTCARFICAVCSRGDLPPLVAFRDAFSICIGANEAHQQFECSLLFEIVYLVHVRMPRLAAALIVRSPLLFFAQMLEQAGRCFSASSFFGNIFLSDTMDSSQAASIAQIAARNWDAVRALFHSIDLPKDLSTGSKREEPLHIGQTIASICIEHGLPRLALSVLSLLLQKAFRTPRAIIP
jgi:hypothetical protein